MRQKPIMLAKTERKLKWQLHPSAAQYIAYLENRIINMHGNLAAIADSLGGDIAAITYRWRPDDDVEHRRDTYVRAEMDDARRGWSIRHKADGENA